MVVAGASLSPSSRAIASVLSGVNYLLPSAHAWAGKALAQGSRGTSRTRQAGAVAGNAPASQQSSKVFLVTGATDGIGKFTAELLAKKGKSTVIIHGRHHTRVERAIAEIRRKAGFADLHGIVADLSLMADVRRMGEEVRSKFPRIHGLLNNAGTFDGDYTGKRVVTHEGNEYSLAVNVLAPFLLTSLLLDNVRASGAGRVIITSSMSAGYPRGLSDLQLSKSYDAHSAYSLSKLCDAMIAMELHERYGDPPRLCFHTLDPDPTSSWIDTKMLRAGWSRGGHPVTRATASYKMLTEDEYGRASGRCWGCSRGGRPKERTKLWDDLTALTKAEWPSFSSPREKAD